MAFSKQTLSEPIFHLGVAHFRQTGFANVRWRETQRRAEASLITVRSIYANDPKN